MADVKELAGRLREEEERLLELYEEVSGAAVGDVDGRIAKQIAEYQKLQLKCLELLAGELPERFMGFGRVVNDSVNLREGPGGSYSLVQKLDRGEAVIIQEYAGYWVRVQVPGGPSGFTFKDYIQQEASF